MNPYFPSQSAPASTPWQSSSSNSSALSNEPSNFPHHHRTTSHQIPNSFPLHSQPHLHHRHTSYKSTAQLLPHHSISNWADSEADRQAHEEDDNIHHSHINTWVSNPPTSNFGRSNIEFSGIQDEVVADDESSDDDENHRVIQTDPSGRFQCWDICLGKGAFKEVYKAFDVEEGVEVAWNQLRTEIISRKDINKLASEVRLLKQLRHDNIINFTDVWTARGPDGRERVYFITELMSSGTLKSFIRKAKGKLKLKVVKNLCRHILRGLAYLHSRNPPIIHRDLKCDNIFINGNNGIAKIGDLGLATIKNKDHISSVLGTPEFMAPELYDEKYDERVDIYAFGMCVLELVTKEYPYQECTNQAQIWKRVSAGIKPHGLTKVTDPETLEFIELCITHDYRGRPSAEELLRHPFLASDPPGTPAPPPPNVSIVSSPQLDHHDLALGIHPSGSFHLDQSNQRNPSVTRPPPPPPPPPPTAAAVSVPPLYPYYQSHSDNLTNRLPWQETVNAPLRIDAAGAAAKFPPISPVMRVTGGFNDDSDVAPTTPEGTFRTMPALDSNRAPFQLTMQVIDFDLNQFTLIVKMSMWTGLSPSTQGPDSSTSGDDGTKGTKREVRFPFHLVEDTVKDIVNEMLREGVVELTSMERADVANMMRAVVYGDEVSEMVLTRADQVAREQLARMDALEWQQEQNGGNLPISINSDQASLVEDVMDPRLFEAWVETMQRERQLLDMHEENQSDGSSSPSINISTCVQENQTSPSLQPHEDDSNGDGHVEEIQNLTWIGGDSSSTHHFSQEDNVIDSVLIPELSNCSFAPPSPPATQVSFQKHVLASTDEEPISNIELQTNVVVPPQSLSTESIINSTFPTNTSKSHTLTDGTSTTPTMVLKRTPPMRSGSSSSSISTSSNMSSESMESANGASTQTSQGAMSASTTQLSTCPGDGAYISQYRRPQGTTGVTSSTNNNSSISPSSSPFTTSHTSPPMTPPLRPTSSSSTLAPIATEPGLLRTLSELQSLALSGFTEEAMGRSPPISATAMNTSLMPPSLLSSCSNISSGPVATRGGGVGMGDAISNSSMHIVGSSTGNRPGTHTNTIIGLPTGPGPGLAVGIGMPTSVVTTTPGTTTAPVTSSTNSNSTSSSSTTITTCTSNSSSNISPPSTNPNPTSSSCSSSSRIWS